MKMKIAKKFIVLCAAGVIGATALAGCGSSASDSTKPDDVPDFDRQQAMDALGYFWEEAEKE